MVIPICPNGMPLDDDLDSLTDDDLGKIIAGTTVIDNIEYTVLIGQVSGDFFLEDEDGNEMPAPEEFDGSQINQ